MAGKSRTRLNDAGAQSREGSAASRLLLLVAGTSNTANIPGILRAPHPEGLARIRPSPGRRGRDGFQTSPGRSNNTHIQRGRVALLKRGRRSPPPTATATEAARMDR